jgi:hypothetical protein
MLKLFRLTILAGLTAMFGAAEDGWSLASVQRKPELADR